MIKTYRIQTSMGQVHQTQQNLPFLNDSECKQLNAIGYTGKDLNGKKTNRQAYLNTLDKGEFVVEQTVWDDGTFAEEFTIIRVCENGDENKDKRVVEMYIGYGTDYGTWTTDYVEIPRDTLDKDILEVAIQQAKDDFQGENYMFSGVYSIPTLDESDNILEYDL